MILLAAIVVAICLRAPYRAESAAPPPPALVSSVPSSAASEPPATAESGQRKVTGTLMATGSVADVVDMVPGRAPSDLFPAGTMWIGAIVGVGEDQRQARLYEWDVERAAIIGVRPVTLDDSNGKINPGAPTAIRLAKDGEHVIAVVEATGGAHALSAEGWVHRTGTRASIAGEAGLVAVAYYTDASNALEVELVHPSFYGADVLGHTRLDGDKIAAGQRPAALAFLHGRLFVATRPNALETVVSELQIPSLRVLRSYRHHRSAASTKHPRSQLFAYQQFLYLLDRGELVELPEYAFGDLYYETRTHRVDADEVAVHAPDQFLTTGGLDEPSTRGDFVSALGTNASCTPAWSPERVRWPEPRVEPYPMLACSVAGGGVQVVRLPRPGKSASP